jgi:RHS repeat-associated protein
LNGRSPNYYPYGMQMPDRCYDGGYDYGFNGMEKQDGIYDNGNSYDFGARILDPRLGRWFSRDPWEYKYPSMSTYCTFANNPIMFVDPSGKGPEDFGISEYEQKMLFELGEKAGKLIITTSKDVYSGVLRRNATDHYARGVDKDDYLDFQTYIGNIIASLAKELGPLTSLDDLRVLQNGKTVSGKKANTYDYLFAAACLPLPTSGGAVKIGVRTWVKSLKTLAKPAKILSQSFEFVRGSRNFLLEQGKAASGWKHIFDRHIDPTRFTDRTKFASYMTESDILEILDKTLKHGTESVYKGDAIFSYVHRGHGKATTYRATVTSEGKIRTFHPMGDK